MKNISGNDTASANGKYQIRIDAGSGMPSVDISGFDNKIHIKAELTPEELSISINGAPFAWITADKTVLASGDGTDAAKLSSNEYQLGFIFPIAM